MSETKPIFAVPPPWITRKSGRVWERDIEPERKRIRDALQAERVPAEIVDRVIAFINALHRTHRADIETFQFSQSLDGGALDWDERMDTVDGLQQMVCELNRKLNARKDYEDEQRDTQHRNGRGA